MKKARKETGLKPLQNFLKRKAHFYAMRQGTRKVVIVSVYHPIEISPFFKSEQGSLKKVVHGSGWMGKPTGGFQHVVMEPLDLSKNTLNPSIMKEFDKCGALLTAIHEQTPLLEEIQVAKENSSILQKKVDGMADDMRKLKNDLEYWKHQARKRGAVEEAERGLKVPPLIRMLIPYIVAFIVGYLLSPSFIYTATLHPMFLGFGFAAALFVIRRWILKR